MSILVIVLCVSVVGLLWLLRKETLNRGKIEEDNKILGANNEALSNRPLTQRDLTERLRNKASKQRKDKR